GGFFLIAAWTILSGLGVVAAKQPVHSALFLVANSLGLAVIYVMLSALFLAAAQVIVYAGAVMVLFLFVVTLLSAGKEVASSREPMAGQKWVSGLLGGGMGLLLLDMALAYPGMHTLGRLPHGFGGLKAVGSLLWGPDFSALLAAAVMLLTAALGVLVLNPIALRRMEPKKTGSFSDADDVVMPSMSRSTTISSDHDASKELNHGPF
ncbi:MAG: NADH-quinone oxidoreductase subunit J, partial [Firmicutes bacterium]|nr:NADH-quinone oxidoreductase subunit J [Bacillota bacterium]